MTSDPSSLQRAVLRVPSWVSDLLAGIPLPGIASVGSALSRVRTQAFLDELGRRVDGLDTEFEALAELEDLVLRGGKAATLAASEAKAKRLAVALATGLPELPAGYSTIVEALGDLEFLSDFDIGVLLQFGQGGAKVQQVAEKIAAVDQPGTEALAEVHGASKKLEARGLLVKDELLGRMNRRYDGDLNHWTGQINNLGFSITPKGVKLLRLIAGQ